MASDAVEDDAERAEHEAFAKQANRETWTLLGTRRPHHGRRRQR